MIPVIYYAHSLRIYNTREEKKELETLEAYFYNGLIFNPNRRSIQRAKDPMSECLRMLKDDSVTSLVFSSIQGYIEAGVYAEIRSAQKQKKPIFYLENEGVTAFHGDIKKSPGKKTRYRIL